MLHTGKSRLPAVGGIGMSEIAKDGLGLGHHRMYRRFPSRAVDAIARLFL